MRMNDAQQKKIRKTRGNFLNIFFFFPTKIRLRLSTSLEISPLLEKDHSNFLNLFTIYKIAQKFFNQLVFSSALKFLGKML
jgi:hypothetical protein